MILTDREILIAKANEEIVIDPFDEKNLGCNSYDVHLGPTLMYYKLDWVKTEQGQFYGLDCKKEPEVLETEMEDTGYVLFPGVLYLASTVEYTETHRHVPYLEGKSSIGRLGMNIHITAGKGDIGFCGYWTMEITVVHPLKVYPGMPIGQLIYFLPQGEVQTSYNKKKSNKYNDTERGESKPKPSMMWKNFLIEQ